MTDPLDVLAIEQVVRRSAALNDRREWSALASLYLPDATLTRPSGERIAGRDAIEASYAAAAPDRRTRHLCGGSLVELFGRDLAHVTTPVLLFSWTHADGDGLPAATGPAIGDFADVLVRVDGAWLIRERVAGLSARVT